MKVFTLIADFPIETCDLSHTLPPTVRTFDFTTQRFHERPKFVQGLFQRLWVLSLLTRAKCQVSVFHTKVGFPNAFTCCRQRLKICVGCRYTDPIAPATITFYSDSANRSMPLPVLVKSISDFIKLPFTCFRIPLAKSQRDTVIKQRPTRTSGIRNRFKRTSRLNMRSTTEFLKETVIRFMNTFEFLLRRLTWQCLPMRVCSIFQKFKVITHALIVYIRKPLSMPLTLPLVEIHMHLPHIIKQVANADRIRLIIKRIFIRFHRETIRYQAFIP